MLCVFCRLVSEQTLVVLLTSEVKAMTVLSYMPVFLSVLTMLAMASSVAVIMAEIIGIRI